MRVSRPSNAPSWARRRRHENGKLSTHCRSPLCGGSTRSNRFAAVAFIRRPVHDGQKPRPLQLNATSRRAGYQSVGFVPGFLYRANAPALDVRVYLDDSVVLDGRDTARVTAMHSAISASSGHTPCCRQRSGVRSHGTIASGSTPAPCARSRPCALVPATRRGDSLRSCAHACDPVTQSKWATAPAFALTNTLRRLRGRAVLLAPRASDSPRSGGVSGTGRDYGWMTTDLTQTLLVALSSGSDTSLSASTMVCMSQPREPAELG